uniref:helicase with zinc finger domain 2 isoform X2 n=1 Tax=Ciona intestinalis TaxID=7719 RepID=UPI000EF53DD7|nr:helicase with zinc finger domain 2 isoform X2 [Ciona intestinalis]|eukprot:XP_026689753.1 helicase with zinc finger domain 2 isoform X2 [Ciona intestinalis]
MRLCTNYKCRDNTCNLAHKEEELREWEQRAKVKQLKLEWAKGHGLMSFVHQINEEYNNSYTSASVMKENLNEVSWKLSMKPTEQKCRMKDVVTWTLTISSVDAQVEKLNHVAFMRLVDSLEVTAGFNVRAVRGKQMTDYVKHINYETSNKYEKFNLNNGRAKFKVQFKPSTYGLFSDRLIIELRGSKRPVLFISFDVQVVPDNDIDIGKTLKSDTTCYTAETSSWELNREIVHLENHNLSDLEKEIARKYKRPDGAIDKIDLEKDLTTSLAVANYKQEMHSFLYREEKARENVLSKFNMKCSVATSDNYMSQVRGLVNSRPNELFGIFEMPVSLNRDTNEGFLMLEHCEKVRVALTGRQSNQLIFELKLEETFLDHAILLLNNKCVEEWQLESGIILDVEMQFQLSRDRFCKCHQAVDLLEKHQLELICPMQFHNFRRPTVNDYKDLDSDQIKVLNGVIETPNPNTVFPLMVVIGPFGTGKTFTMTKSIQYILENVKDARILICTHSNSAADLYIENNIGEKEWEGNVLRVLYHGRSPQTVPEYVRKCCLYDKGQFCYPTTQQVLSKKIVVATFSTAIYLGRKGTGLEGVFTHVFLDEASQVMEAEVIIPLTLVLNNKTKVVIAGDHKQICEKVYSKKGGADARFTLLDRLYKKYKELSEKQPTPLQGFVYLRNNYRCVEPILELISSTFYKEHVLNCCSRKTTPRDLAPIQFHHIAGTCVQHESTSGYYNEAEAVKTVDIALELVNKYHINPKDIIVLAAYMEQITIIRSLMRKASLRDVKVDRIRSIQGREYRVVLLSSVHRRLSKKDKEGSSFGLFSDVNLLNTAITRCEISIIFVGDAVSLCSMGNCRPKWRNIVKMSGILDCIFPRTVTWEWVEQQVALMSSLNPHAMQFVPKQTSGPVSTIQSSNLISKDEVEEPLDQSTEDSDSEDEMLDDMLEEHTGYNPQDMVIDVNREGIETIRQIPESEPHSYEDDEPLMHSDRRREILHPQLTVQHLQNLKHDEPDLYKRCEIRFITWYHAEATVMDSSDLVRKIQIMTKRRRGQAFNRDEVLVKLHEKREPDQIEYFGTVVGILKRFRELDTLCFVCFPDKDNCHIMAPLSNKETKFAIVKERGLDKSENLIPIYPTLRKTKNGKIDRSLMRYERYEPDSSTTRHSKLFVVQFYKWNKYSYHPLGYVKEVIYSGDQHKHYQIMSNIPSPYRDSFIQKSEDLLKVEHREKRRDLTDLYVFTIDPDGSKDLDDAMSIEPCKKHNNCWKVGVHIADVATILPQNHDLDNEAMKRGVTFYAGENRQHMRRMLPPNFSEKHCSLLPDGEPRLTISMFFHSSKPPNPTLPDATTNQDAHIPVPVLTRIKSNKQLTYLEAETLLREARQREDNSFTAPNENNISQQLYHIWQFMIILRKQRLQASIFFQQPDTQKLTEFFNEASAHMLIEEAMITYNACCAVFLKNKGTYLLRSQEIPDEQEWAEWIRKQKNIIQLSLHLESTVEYMATQKESNEVVPWLGSQAGQIPVLKNVAHHILEALNRNDIETAMLLCSDTIQPALAPGYSGLCSIWRRAEIKVSDNVCEANPATHFSLRLPLYSQCTSPIRRYADIISQRLILSICKTQSLKRDHPKDVVTLQHNETRKFEKVCGLLSARSEDAKEYEKGMQTLELANKLQKNPKSFTAIVVELTDRGIQFSFPDLKIHPKATALSYSDIQVNEKTPHLDNSQKDRDEFGGETTILKVELKWLINYYKKNGNDDSALPGVTKLVSRRHWQEMNHEIRQEINRPNSFVDPESRDKISSAIRRVFGNLQGAKVCQRKTFGVGPCTSDLCEGKCSDHMTHASKLGIKHRRRITATVKPGSTFHVQLMSVIKRYLLTPTIKLFPVAPDLSICVYHRRNPVEAFAPNVKAIKGTKITTLEEYEEQWLPLVQMDGAYCAVADDDSVVISGVDIKCFQTTGGKIKGKCQIETSFCGPRQIRIIQNDFLCLKFLKQDKQSIESCVEHAIVTSHKDNELSFELINPCFQELRESIPKVDIEILQLGVTHRRMANTLCKLLNFKPKSILKFLCCNSGNTNTIPLNRSIENLEEKIQKLKEKIHNDCLHGFEHMLNAGQAKQVEKALMRKVTLIQGPPGTGKSYMGAQLACYFHEFNRLLGKKDNKILYCGPTNKAVNVVAGYLKNAGLRVLRVFGTNAEEEDFPNPLKPVSQKLAEPKSEQLKQMSLHFRIRDVRSNPYAEEILKYDKMFLHFFEYKDFQNFVQVISKAKLWEFKQSEVIVSTCISATQISDARINISKESGKSLPFKVAQCIVDETGMCSEPETLTPIVASQAEQVVLIGDHKQLQPIVTCKEASELGLSKSMFERLKNYHKADVGMLTNQYRMNQTICQFPSDHFYGGQLTVDQSVTERELRYPPLFYHGNQENTAVFCHVVGEELSGYKMEHRGESKTNKEEASRVILILRMLHYKLKIPLSDIMILSPYKAQCSLIKDLINKARADLNKVDVGTVVTSQGGERDYVILSTVRSLKSHSIEENPGLHWLRINLGFVADAHQINVAITRARRGLCIVGNKDLLCKDPETWRDLLESYEQRRAVVTVNDLC